MPLINCKVELSLTWNENCGLAATSNANNATFNKIDAKLYVPLVTLSTEDSAKLSNQLSKGFKRPVYWNKYKVIDNKLVEITDVDEEKYIREMLDSSYQGVKGLFVLAYDNQVIKFLLILRKYIFFQEYQLEITTMKLLEEVFMINQLMTHLSNTMKLEKYQLDKLMIIQLVLYWITNI